MAKSYITDLRVASGGGGGSSADYDPAIASYYNPSKTYAKNDIFFYTSGNVTKLYRATVDNPTDISQIEETTVAKVLHLIANPS